MNPTLIFFASSIIAEMLTITVHFPYDLIKCRIQSKNYIFKYKNLPHAFKKEIKNNGFFSLYQGAFPFLLTYVSFVSLQFTIYESMMSLMKKRYSAEKVKKNKMLFSLPCGLIAGCIAAAVTNPLECVTVNKQISSNFNVKEFIRTEGLMNICTKGIVPRVVYNGA